MWKCWNSKKWEESGHISKIECTDFVEGLDIPCLSVAPSVPFMPWSYRSEALRKDYVPVDCAFIFRGD